MDLWIAATALAHSLPVYTRNVEDFTPLRPLIEVFAV
jgi:predicted nucleic acid-binding protein